MEESLQFVFCYSQSEDYNTVLGFKMSSHKHAKAIWKTCVEYHSFFRLKRMPVSTTRHLNLSKSYFTSCKDAAPETPKEIEDKSIKFNKSRTIAENRVNERVANVNLLNGNGNTSSSSSNGNGGNGKLSFMGITKSYKTYDNKVTSKQMETLPRKAWEQQK